MKRGMGERRIEDGERRADAVRANAWKRRGALEITTSGPDEGVSLSSSSSSVATDTETAGGIDGARRASVSEGSRDDAILL